MAAVAGYLIGTWQRRSARNPALPGVWLRHPELVKTMSIEWRLSPFEGAQQLEPLVDGAPLVELIAEFEKSHGYQPADGYAGLVLGNYDFGDLRVYLTGEQQPWPGQHVPLLGCQCGEWGCWPLFAQVTISREVVTWDGFEQPHRKERDYAGFGPFTFEETAYRTSILTALASMDRPLDRVRLVAFLDREGVRPAAYSLDGGHPAEKHVIDRRGSAWVVYYSERGLESGLTSFTAEVDALGHLLDLLITDPTTRRR